MLRNVCEVPDQLVGFTQPEKSHKMKFRTSRDQKENSPSRVRFRLNVFNAAVHRHGDGDVQQRRRRGHRVAVVLVVDLDVRMRRLALPVRDKLEWTRLGAGFALHRVLQNVDVEVRRGRVLFRLPTQQESQRWHVELQRGAHVGRLEFVTGKKQSSSDGNIAEVLIPLTR